IPLEAPVTTTIDSDRAGRMMHLRAGDEQARCQPLLAVPVGAVYAASMPAAKAATTLVLLVRHGVTPTTGRLLPGRRRGLHLSDEGRRQADALAARLAVVPKIGAIYSSPLERARETVGPLARMRGQAVRVERGLLESDLGAWTGLSLK